MKMVTIEISRASPIQLAWLTAKLEDWSDEAFLHPDFPYVGGPMGKWDPALDWRQGGQIIEQEHIQSHWAGPVLGWAAMHPDYKKYNYSYGPTPLIAAVRCYATSRLGDEVEIPEILL